MGRVLFSSASAFLLAAASAFPAAAQDSHAGHGAPAIELPAICRVAVPAGQDGAHAPEAAPAEGIDAGHQALLRSMSQMHETMGAAMMAPDLDVAFVCGMIPHHQGAIAMARAEIEHGDDEWAKSLAEQVIAAQEQEIADMLEWLKKQEQAQ